MEDEFDRQSVFDREDPDGPTESDWITIGDRRYKVFKIPSQLSGKVTYFCQGSLTAALIGTFFYVRAVRRSSTWAARVYWQEKHWYNGRWHRVLQEEFDTMDEAGSRAKELEQLIRNGQIPSG